MSRRLFPIAPLLAIVALVLAGGCVSRRVVVPTVERAIRPAGVTVPDSPWKARNAQVFMTVWNEINKNYYDPAFNGVDWQAAVGEFLEQTARAPDEAALYRTLNEMLGRLNDGHTGALPPRQARIISSQRFTGIGVQARREGERHVVGHVMTGGPAEKAGIQPGWKVISRDGMAFEQAVGVPLKVGQISPWVFEDLTGNRVELRLAAAEMKTTHREARRLPGGIAYVRFDGFDFESIDWLRDRLAEHRDARGAILDLRHNPGGVVASALYALGHFIDNGQIVAVTLARGEDRTRWTPLGKASARYPGKVAVLVSGDSSSASEVLAAVLQEHGRGVVIGQQTSGSVLGARLVPLPDGGMLEYSVNDLLTARGVRLEGTGVTPDIAVPPLTTADGAAGRDLALERAVEELSR